MRTNYLPEWKWPVHPVWTNMFRPMTSKGGESFWRFQRLKDGKVRALCRSSEYLLTDPECNTTNRSVAVGCSTVRLLTARSSGNVHLFPGWDGAAEKAAMEGTPQTVRSEGRGWGLRCRPHPPSDCPQSSRGRLTKPGGNWQWEEVRRMRRVEVRVRTN